MPAKGTSTARKAILDSEVMYYLTGESTLAAATLPDRPTSKQPTIVRVTHTNSYGRVDSDIFVRVGDPKSPLDAEDFDSVSDWQQARLVEELVWNIHKEDWIAAPQDIEGEALWCATYEAEFQFQPGEHLIEIKIISREQAVCSIVLSNWSVKVK
jgi:hypothetical protein